MEIDNKFWKQKCSTGDLVKFWFFSQIKLLNERSFWTKQNWLLDKFVLLNSVHLDFI